MPDGKIKLPSQAFLDEVQCHERREDLRKSIARKGPSKLNASAVVYRILFMVDHSNCDVDPREKSPVKRCGSRFLNWDSIQN